MAVVFNLGTDGNWAYEDASLLPYYVDANNKYNGVPMSAFRAGIATRTTREGLLESMTVDIPRIDFAENANGQLLTEDAVTNLLFNSGWLGGGIDTAPTNWNFSSDGGVTSSLQSIKAPFVNAHRFTTNANRARLRYSINLTLGNTYAYSVYVEKVYTSQQVQETLKQQTITGVERWYKNGVQVAGTTLVEEGNTYQYELDATSTGLGSFAVGSGVGDNAVTGDVVLSMPMAGLTNVGGLGSFILSPIGATEQRAADTGITTGDISHLINSEEGVIDFSITLPSSENTRYISLSDGTPNNRIIFIFLTNGNMQVQSKVNDNTTIVNISAVLNFNVRYRVTFVWGLNNYKLYVDDVKIGENLSAITFNPNILNRFALSNYDASSQPFFGRIDYLKIHDSADDY